MKTSDLLAELDALTEKEYAQLRGIGIAALRNERARGGGPAYTRNGRMILYPKAKLREWLAQRTVTPDALNAPTLIDGTPGRRRRARKVAS
jgi:hypothetical protein